MLGKVEFWHPEGGVGSVIDVDGKSWHIQDDMIDDDEVKAKLAKGLVVNFEPNPTIWGDNGMSVSVASSDDESKFSDAKATAKKAMESKMTESLKSEWDKAEEERDECQTLLKKEKAKSEPDKAKIKDLSK